MIYTIYHGPNAPHGETEFCVPLSVNRSDGNSLANDVQLEMMRGQYWVWKNAKWLTEVGFQHYRRWMDFSSLETKNIEPKTQVENGFIYIPKPIPLKAYGYDIITAAPWTMSGGLTVEEQFRQAHDGQHLDVLFKFVPQFRPFAEQKSYYVCSIFWMRWKFFAEYMTFWWDVIRRVRAEIYIPEIGYASRALGFLSERIWSFWLSLKMENYLSLRVGTVPLLMDLGWKIPDAYVA